MACLRGAPTKYGQFAQNQPVLNFLLVLILNPNRSFACLCIFKRTRRIARAFARLELKIQKFACHFILLKDYTIFYHASLCSLS